jgi:hypothetical protein
VNFTLEINGKYAPGMFYTPPATDAHRVKFMVYDFAPANPAEMERLYKAMYDRIYDDPAFHTFILQTGAFAADAARLTDWDRQFFSRDAQSKHARYVLSRLPVMGAVPDPSGLARKILPYPYRDGAYYSFDYGPVHIVMLDPGKSCAPGSPQYRWLQADLESTPNTWKAVMVGGTPDTRQTAKGAPIRQLVQPLCEEYGVDVWFGGDDAGANPSKAGAIQHVVTGSVVPKMDNLYYSAITIDGDMLTVQAISPEGKILRSFKMKDNSGAR